MTRRLRGQIAMKCHKITHSEGAIIKNKGNFVQSIFRYPGGKTRKKAREWVLKHEPAGCLEYREPFVGGGGIFFAVDTAKNRWINDKDEHLVSVYEALRDRPEDFIAKCCAIPVYQKANRGAEFQRLKEEFTRIAFDDKEDKALRFFFVNRTVFAGRVNYERKSRLYFSKPEGWTEAALERLGEASQSLQGVKITTGDYEPLLLSSGSNVWVYCDPPYVKSLKSTSLLYRHNFDTPDHERLAETVKRSPHKVCVSYEDDPDGVVRSLYKGFNIVELEWTYAGSWNPDENGQDKKRRGKELLILNYEAK